MISAGVNKPIWKKYITATIAMNGKATRVAPTAMRRILSLRFLRSLSTTKATSCGVKSSGCAAFHCCAGSSCAAGRDSRPCARCAPTCALSARRWRTTNPARSCSIHPCSRPQAVISVSCASSTSAWPSSGLTLVTTRRASAKRLTSATVAARSASSRARSSNATRRRVSR